MVFAQERLELLYLLYKYMGLELGLYPVTSSTKYIEMRTHVQFWTHVRILACLVKLTTRHKPLPMNL